MHAGNHTLVSQWSTCAQEFQVYTCGENFEYSYWTRTVCATAAVVAIRAFTLVFYFVRFFREWTLKNMFINVFAIGSFVLTSPKRCPLHLSVGFCTNGRS